MFAYPFKLNRYKAFTLSEVMLVLSVIGVIAALTIPGIMQNTQNAQTVAKLKKEYSVIHQAYTSLLSDNDGDIVPVYNSDATGVMNAFLSKMNVLKVCGTAAMGCFPSNPPGYHSDIENNIAGRTYSKAVLSDGTSIMFELYSTNCTASATGTAIAPLGSTCGTIAVDLNGTALPNISGRDNFWFWVTKTGIYPMGTYNDGYNCSSATVTIGCTAKVLTEGKMNY